MNRGRFLLLAALTGLLAGITAWSHANMLSAKQGAHQGANGLAACEALIQEIRRHNHRPALATDHEKVASETTGLIETSLGKAEIRQASLLRIVPEPARRLGDSDYMEKPTRVFLRDVTLVQLARFAYGILRAESGLAVRSLRIASRHPDDTGDLWGVEMSLTYLIFDPPR